MKKLLRDNGLSLALSLIFLLCLVGHALSGWHHYNAEQSEHARRPVSLGAYLATGVFGESVFENWESEFLQMGVYVVLTAFLFQRGSAESKDPDETAAEIDENPARARNDPAAPGPVRAGGWRLAIYRNSLSLALFGLFALSFAGHAWMGSIAANEDAVIHGQATQTVPQYLGNAQFWFESFQNWQSEFLSILAVVLLSIWLRQYGSPESKPVAAPHSQTGS